MNPPSFEKSQESSSLAPSYSTFTTQFASLSLHESDRIRLVKFPESDIAAIRAAIKTSYPFGIQRERTYGVSFEFKLYSYPWQGQGSDAIPSRIVMREILAHLFRTGWIMHASTDISKKSWDKDTMFFRKQQSPPPESDWISISFNQMDRLRLIGADQVLIQAVRDLLKAGKLLQSEAWKDQKLGAWEFKIYGNPWWASGEETMRTRFLLLGLLEVLESHGWSLYASIDQSTGHGDRSSETDSWHCVREKAWVPGMAVFHR